MTEYELWSFGPVWREARWGWIFHGFHELTLDKVLNLNAWGYRVRKVIGDRPSTIPLFPILDPSEEYPDQGMD